MSKNATISMRIDDQLKSDVESIFHKLGLTTSEAIKIFFAAVRNRKGMPFQLQVASDQASPLEQRKTALDSIINAYPMMSSSNDFARMKKDEVEREERKRKG